MRALLPTCDHTIMISVSLRNRSNNHFRPETYTRLCQIIPIMHSSTNCINSSFLPSINLKLIKLKIDSSETCHSTLVIFIYTFQLFHLKMSSHTYYTCMWFGIFSSTSFTVLPSSSVSASICLRMHSSSTVSSFIASSNAATISGSKME